ncbi:MAG: hypothetical protein KDA93_06755 [Planctomycetaceae bacterium]|nr:hypothetical protein [Planctomycetaceae bacterium]
MERMNHCLLMFTAVVLGITQSCSSDGEVLLEASAQIKVPENFVEEDATWEKLDGLSEPDMTLLQRFFQENQSMTENSIIDGDPVVFEADRKGRRYYWVRPGGDGAEWLCLEFSRQGVTLLEGNGAPFLGG